MSYKKRDKIDILKNNIFGVDEFDVILFITLIFFWKTQFGAPLEYQNIKMISKFGVLILQWNTKLGLSKKKLVL